MPHPFLATPHTILGTPYPILVTPYPILAPYHPILATTHPVLATPHPIFKKFMIFILRIWIWFRNWNTVSMGELAAFAIFTLL